MRKPNLSPPELRPSQREAPDEIEITLVTPMLGGGVVAGRVDEDYPIRASSVRGALRHWWRATTGVTLSSPEEMRMREASLFGLSSGDGTPGCLAVKVVSSQNARPSLLRDSAEDIPAYARGILIEKQETPQDKLNQVLPAGFKFTVCLSVRDLDEEPRTELLAALEAWIRFGGIGARTRRGFGALSTEREMNFLGQVLNRGNGFPLEPGFTSLQNARLLCSKKAGKSANAAWGLSVGMLSRFRKAESPQLGEPPRDGKVKGGRMGKTPWPEAMSIRSGKDLKLPRAAFGIPMQIRSLVRGDFGEFHVFGYGDSDRLASPLICRPVKIDHEWYAAVLILGHVPPVPEKVRAGQRIGEPASKRVSLSAESHPSRLKGDSAEEQPFDQPHSDVLDAFAHYLTVLANWQEVPLV